MTGVQTCALPILIVDVQRGPSWAEQSLTALVEAEDRDLIGSSETLDFPSLAEMAAAEDFGEDGV